MSRKTAKPGETARGDWEYRGGNYRGTGLSKVN